MYQIFGITYSADFRSQHGRIALYLENKSVSEKELRNVLLDMPNVEYLSVKSKSALSSSIAGALEAFFIVTIIIYYYYYYYHYYYQIIEWLTQFSFISSHFNYWFHYFIILLSMLQSLSTMSSFQNYFNNCCDNCLYYVSYLIIFRRGRSESADSCRVHAPLQRISLFHCILCHSHWRASFVSFASAYILPHHVTCLHSMTHTVPTLLSNFRYSFIITLPSSLPPPSLPLS